MEIPVERIDAQAQPRDPMNERIIDPQNPRSVARLYLREQFTQDGIRTLQHFDGFFLGYDGIVWKPLQDDTLSAFLYGFLEESYQVVGKNGEIGRVIPTRRMVSEILHALKALVHLPAPNFQPPVWLHPKESDVPNPRDIMTCSNGLLNLQTLSLLPHTPQFFGISAVGFEFDPSAPEPKNWMKFLDDLFEGDAESREFLQELFGYLLTYDTSLQKIFLIIGPKRSGKGTIARILRALLGNDNVAGPTLASFRSNFGLQILIGKRLAIIADARLGPNVNQQAIAERLIAISGEDLIDIDRKYLAPVSVQLPTRILIISNELPGILDASGALPSRFHILRLTESFFGREDTGLFDRLLPELPGILNWAHDGLVRLRDRGHFLPPKSGIEVGQEMERLSSPIKTFVADRCEIGPQHSAGVNKLYQEYCAWLSSYRYRWPPNVETFSKDLRAAEPQIETKQRRLGDGKRERYFSGIGLRDGASLVVTRDDLQSLAK